MPGFFYSEARATGTAGQVVCSNDDLRSLLEELREEMRRYQTANRMAMDRQDSRIREIKQRQDDQDKQMETAVFTHADFEAALLRTVWRVITDKRALTLLVILAVVAGIAGDAFNWLIDRINAGFVEVPPS